MFSNHSEDKRVGVTNSTTLTSQCTKSALDPAAEFCLATVHEIVSVAVVSEVIMVDVMSDVGLLVFVSNVDLVVVGEVDGKVSLVVV